MWPEQYLFRNLLNAKIVSPLILTYCLLSLSCARTHKQHHPVCTAFVASDFQILDGTQLPLSSTLAFWCRIRVGDITAASNKVKKMDGMSAFLWRSCWAKSNRKFPVSTPSKIKVCEFTSWYMDKTNVCLLKSLLWKTNFYLSPS